MLARLVLSLTLACAAPFSGAGAQAPPAPASHVRPEAQASHVRPEAPASHVRIAVLAHRGAEVAARQWGGHAAYLSASLAPVTFEMVPLSYHELTDAVETRSVQFVITNTGHYTELELAGHVTRIATRVVAGPSGPLERFGGVAFALAGRADVAGYADIAGRRLLVPDRSSLGGWQVHLLEARDAGLDIEKAVSSITETHNHEDVVRGILDGSGDIGFVRSDVLEQMAARGEIRLDAFRVVAPKSEKGYPYRLSTRLYPEWPFARVTGTPEDLSRDVLIALLNLPAEAEAARTAGLVGWTVPLSYKPVDDLFRILRLGPYASLDFAFKDVLTRYWPWLAAAAAIILGALLAAFWRVWRSRGQLRAEIRRRAEAEQSLRRLEEAVEQSPNSVVITDTAHNVLYVNSTYCRLSGHSRDEIEGTRFRFLDEETLPDATRQDLRQAMDAGRVWTGDLTTRRKDGTVMWERATVSPVVDAAGTVIAFLSVRQDITLQRSYEDALDRAANFDSLTGLPNRALAHDRLERHLVEGDSAAVLLVAIDNLTRINDSLSQEAGDAVIREMARRFSDVLAPADTVARIGGDEFLVVRSGVRDGVEADRLATMLAGVAARPVSAGGIEVRVTVRIGVALSPRDGRIAIELEKAAYSAATRAREAGGNTIRHFQQTMDAESRWRIEAEHGLRLALEGEGLELHMQPYVQADSGIYVGAEALIRWRRPGEGFVQPARFIPVAEGTGLIRDIDRWVIEQAAAAAAELRAELGQIFPVAVNISPVDLHDTAIVDYTHGILRRFSLPPEALEIEITEGVFLADEENAGVALRAFDALGIGIAIDDFGTGYSSLAYLRRYPVRKLKIDRTFVAGVDGDPKLIGLASAISAMARHLGLTVTAEGVEREAEWRILRDAGCDYIQGFLFARPMTLAELKGLVKAPALAPM